MSALLTVLIAARDEEQVIASTVAALREAFPDAEVVVADDGSNDATAARAEAAGARVVRLPRRGKGQALTVAEATGRVALVFLLGGARPGSYGMGKDAVDGVLPDAPPVPTPADE